jgi:hypothetical protein
MPGPCWAWGLCRAGAAERQQSSLWLELRLTTVLESIVKLLYPHSPLSCLSPGMKFYFKKRKKGEKSSFASLPKLEDQHRM